MLASLIPESRFVQLDSENYMPLGDEPAWPRLVDEVRASWVQSYVTDDKIHCVYVAPDEATVKTHAERCGFPANVVARSAR